MRRSIFRGKSLHTKIFTAITIVGILLVIGLNMLLTFFSTRSTMYIDLTTEGFYSLSENMRNACDDLFLDESGKERDVSLKFTFCADPDALIGSDLMRPTYYMALELKDRYDCVEVHAEDITYNPTLVSAYKTTSRDTIKQTDVIVSYGSKYRVVDATTLWTSIPSYVGEYRMATVMSSLLAIDKPKAYFVTDHKETFYDPRDAESEGSKALGEFADLLHDCGLEIDTLELSSVDRIPEDCVLLIINDPREDLRYDPGMEYGYRSESEILDMYVYGGGSLMITKDPTLTLTNLEELAAEWGIRFNNCIVKDSDNAIGISDTKFSAEYDTDELEFGYAYYSTYASLSSAPKMAFKNTGYITCSFVGTDALPEPGASNTSRTYAPFIGTYDTAKAYHQEGALYADAGYKCLAAASVRKQLDSVDATNTYSYMFCVNSAEFLSNELLGSASHSNRDVLSTLVQSLARTDRHADTSIGGFSLNAGDNFGGKLTVSLAIAETENTVFLGNYGAVGENRGLSKSGRNWLFVLVMLPAAGALVLGAVVYIKRKFK